MTGKLMVPLIEMPKLGEGAVFEGLEYEKFGVWLLSLRPQKDIEAEVSVIDRK